MMTDGIPIILEYAPLWIVGFALGIFYFGGLWLTVQYLTRSSRPALVSMVSLLVRMAVTLIGFYLVLDGQWLRLIVCLVGFFVARFVLIQRWRPAKHEATTANRRDEGLSSDTSLT